MVAVIFQHIFRIRSSSWLTHGLKLQTHSHFHYTPILLFKHGTAYYIKKGTLLNTKNDVTICCENRIHACTAIIHDLQR